MADSVRGGGGSDIDRGGCVGIASTFDPILGRQAGAARQSQTAIDRHVDTGILLAPDGSLWGWGGGGLVSNRGQHLAYAGY
jgi:hypothetical protein